MPTRPDPEPLVVRALTSHGIPRDTIAREFGCSGAMVGHIRAGTRLAKVRPDLPRWRSCEHCGHWLRMACSLGFPEPEEVGFWQAAAECSAFIRR